MFYETHVGRLMAPFVDALVGATVRPGDAVLDVACGTGFATRAAAAVAGRGARVEGADLNPAMVAQARTVPDASGADLRWRQASGLDLPFGEGEFDAVLCQQGIQFFPDPAAGIREMARVARTGGRVGTTVWSSLDSPFLDRETAMLASCGGGAQAEYSTTEAQLRAWFADGGVDDVRVEPIEVEIDLPPVTVYVPEHLKALPWSVGFFALPPADQQAALAALDDRLAEYRTDDGLRIPFRSHLATATI
ncbi:MAG: class I SAM-dependent methyltransferase [Ilumatobacteraceae bacterium]